MRLVDADALVKTIESNHCKDCSNYNGAMCRACTWMDAMDYIEDAPAVDNIPRGKWNELKDTIIEMRDNGCTALQTDVCKFLTNLMEILEKEGVFPTLFCPCCGAKMYEEEMEADEDEQTQ